MVSIHYCLRRRSDMSLEQFSAYWRGPHAELVMRLAQDLGIIRYVQHHSIGPQAASVLQAPRAAAALFDGIAEISFANLQALERGNFDPATAQAQALLAEDEARFIDTERSEVMFTQANMFIV